MFALAELYYFFINLPIAIWDRLVGHRRRRYEASVLIHATPDVVWQVARGRDITLDALVPIRVLTDPVAGTVGVERIRLQIGRRELTMMTRLVDVQEGKALLLELLNDGTTTSILVGHDDYIGLVIEAVAGGTMLYFMREVTASKWLMPVIIPMRLRLGARRYKRTAEKLGAESQRPT